MSGTMDGAASAYTRKVSMNKKKRPNDQEPAIHELAHQALHKADAIRLVRHHLLKQGREPETAEIAAVLEKTQWTTGDLDRDKNYISSILSQDRTREGQPPGKPGRRPRAGLFPVEPTATELKRVKELAEAEAGSLEDLAAALAQVDAIASEVGGFERLKKCIAFWKELEERE
jgi:hypothetical protein